MPLPALLAAVLLTWKALAPVPASPGPPLTLPSLLSFCATGPLAGWALGAATQAEELSRLATRFGLLVVSELWPDSVSAGNSQPSLHQVTMEGHGAAGRGQHLTIDAAHITPTAA